MYLDGVGLGKVEEEREGHVITSLLRIFNSLISLQTSKEVFSRAWEILLTQELPNL